MIFIKFRLYSNDFHQLYFAYSKPHPFSIDPAILPNTPQPSGCAELQWFRQPGWLPKISRKLRRSLLPIRGIYRDDTSHNRRNEAP